MKKLNFYKEVLGCNNTEEVFDFFMSSLKPSMLTWTYFVNWEKVLRNTRPLEIALNNLNYLIGKENFDDEFRLLIKENPRLASTLPALSVRDGANTNKFKILIDYSAKKLVYSDYDFSITNPTNKDIENYLLFVTETGLKKLITSRKISNLVDYMIGVEAGLDSNGRKNRSGTSMETVVRFFINDYCENHNFSYLEQANAVKIKQKWGITVPVDRSSRRYDFVVNTGSKIVLFETNFYGGGGSKLKATAGEYKGLHDVLKDNFQFVWVTDGLGWNTARLPLEQAFYHNDFIVNLTMIEQGVLGHLLKQS